MGKMTAETPLLNRRSRESGNPLNRSPSKRFTNRRSRESGNPEARIANVSLLKSGKSPP